MLLSNIGCLGDSSGDIGTFGDADTDAVFAVTDDDEGAEAEAAATFDDTGDTVDVQCALVKLLFFWSYLWTTGTAVIATSATVPALSFWSDSLGSILGIHI